MTLYTQQSKNVWRTWLLMSLFFVVIIVLGSTISYVYDSSAILYIAVIFAVGMNIMSYWYSDKIVLKTSAAVPADSCRSITMWMTECRKPHHSCSVAR